MPTQEPASIVCNCNDDGQDGLFYSACPHRNLHQSFVTTTGRTTCFTQRAHTGTCASHTQPTQAKTRLVRRSGKCEVDWTGKEEIRGIPGSGRSMQGYILTYSSFKRRTFDSSGFSVEVTFIFMSTVLLCRRRSRVVNNIIMKKCESRRRHRRIKNNEKKTKKEEVSR